MNELKHVAIIMDGNGRWAKGKGLSRTKGHIEGAKHLVDLVNNIFATGVEYLSVYAFSTENWKRSDDEVNGLLKLFAKYMGDIIDGLKSVNYKINIIGDKSFWNKKVITLINSVEKSTSKYTEHTLNICFNYGGRDEIVHAVNKLIKEGKEEITEEDITKNIYTGFMPPPDMIIRTGKEKRISNFFLWQLSYSELFFTDTLWPDFTIDEFKSLVDEYFLRKRRYGDAK